MTRKELKTHAQVIRRAIERQKATPEPNELVISAMRMIEQEYLSAHEWVQTEPE